MNHKIFLFYLLLFLSLCGIKSYGQLPDELHLQRTSQAIIFDGMVDEAEWQKSTEVALRIHFPVYNALPEEKSRVHITYDDNYLWIGAILYYTNMDKLTATSKKRDEESSNSDSFGIILDSYNDNENALGFFTMPTGAKIDYTISNDGQMVDPSVGSKNYTWNAFWDVKTTIGEASWQVEMRIPFSSLRFQKIDDVIKMGLIVNRQISYLNEIDTYPPIDSKIGPGSNTRPSLAQTIVIQNIRNSNPVYISPYVLGGISSINENTEEQPENTAGYEREFTGGLDVKYNLNNNITLDFTVNTDFAQVEADNEVLNLTRYSLFLPEKRLFFQERSGIFSFDLGGHQNLFYSRNIGLNDGQPVQIIGGARMVGRIGKWDVGILDMNTAKFNTDPAENFGVARIRRQVLNENSYIGGMLTTRIDFNGMYNMAYGLDGIFKISKDNYLDLKMAQTIDESRDNKFLSTEAAYFSAGLQKRSEEGFAYEGKYAFWGKNFRPGTGFILINSVHEARGNIGYSWYQAETSPLFKINPLINFNLLNRIDDGQIESMMIAPEISVITKKGYFLTAGVSYQEEGVANDFDLYKGVSIVANRYSFWEFFSMFSTPRTGKLLTHGVLHTGEFYDGTRFSLSLTPEYSISSTWQLTAGYQLDVVNFPLVNQRFINNIARCKVTCMVNTKLSISTFVQYNEGTNTLMTNFRLRYNPKDGNNFYLVMNDSRDSFNIRGDQATTINSNQLILAKYTHTFKL